MIKLKWKQASKQLPNDETVAWFYVLKPEKIHFGEFNHDSKKWKSSTEGFFEFDNQDDVYWIPFVEYSSSLYKNKIVQSAPQYVVCEHYELLEEMKKALRKIGIHLYKDPTNSSTTLSFVVSVEVMTPKQLKEFCKKQWQSTKTS